ncbi:MAG: hypothetical protein ACJ8FS_16410 [Sphingomicrobium sp.]
MRQTKKMLARRDLQLRMTEAKARLIERKMIPRAFYLVPRDFELFSGETFDHVPVRCVKGKKGNVLYSTRGCMVMVPVKL